MNAVILVGHGSLRQASGASMIRLAALLRKQGVAPIATAGFLNFSKPTVADAVERCARKGATHIVVQPYFLIPGFYVKRILPKLIAEARAAHPALTFSIADAFEYHPALVQMVLDRAAVARTKARCALLLIAHGTPHEEANAPIYEVAKTLRGLDYAAVQVSFMEINTPDIAKGIQKLVDETSAEQIVAAPYFLQLGGHVALDLPEAIGTAQEVYPNIDLKLADYLSYDALLTEVIAQRVSAHLPVAHSNVPTSIN